jgi:hypothetical protein
MVNRSAWLALHALLGAVLGMFYAFIFALLYYGTTYSLPISNAARARSAFWIAAFMMLAILVVFDLIIWRNLIPAAATMITEDDPQEGDNEK